MAVRGSALSLRFPRRKLEIRSSKFETNSNQNKSEMTKTMLLRRFGFRTLDHSDLFRISTFEFRIFASGIDSQAEKQTRTQATFAAELVLHPHYGLHPQFGWNCGRKTA